MKKIFMILLACSLLIPFTRALAQGDNCGSAVVVTPGAYTADGPSTGFGCHLCSGADHADWYTYTAPSYGELDIVTCLGGANTTLNLYDGSCGALNLILSYSNSCDDGTGGFNINAAAVYGEYTYPGQVFYIEFDDSDDISGFTWSLGFTPDLCPDPENLNVFNVTATTVDIEWNDLGAFATSYEIWIEDELTGTLVTDIFTTSNPHTVTGLTSGTTYQYWVQSFCSQDTSDWVPNPSNPGLNEYFTTACEEFAPYTQTFSNGNFQYGSLPPCWSESAIAGVPWEFSYQANWGAAIFNDHTGDTYGKYALANLTFGSGNDSAMILEMPELNISALGTIDLSFWFGSFNDDDSDLNLLFIEAWDGANWNTIDSLQQNTPVWIEHIYSLNSHVYNMNFVKVRFRVEEDPNGSTHYTNDLLIDDVTIDGAVGINDIIGGFNLNIWPNPNNGIFTFNVHTKDVSELEIRVANLQGQIVWSKNNFDNISNVNESVDLSNNAKGVYFVTIVTNNGFSAEKLIIH